MWLKYVIALFDATNDDSTWPQALRLQSVAGAYQTCSTNLLQGIQQRNLRLPCTVASCRLLLI